MTSGNTPQREEYLRKRRNKRLIRYGILAFLLLVLIALFSYISHIQKFRVSKVVLSGGVLVTEEEVQNKTTEYLSGSYFWLFPKNNTFWYPKDNLEVFLKDSFKRIETISIKKKGLVTLEVKIKERKPYAIWCKGLPESQEEIPECYFMDQNSTIFAPAPNFSGDAYFKYYGQIRDGSALGQEYMASTTKFISISDFVGNVKSLALKPQYVIQKGEDDYSLILNGGGEILFDTKESLYKTAQNLAALLKTNELKNLDRNNLGVQYVDLRFGNKLFYKLR